MALDRIKGEIVFLCDGENEEVCHEDLETGERDFTEAKATFDSLGWKAFSKGRDRWGHRCPACAAAWAKRRRGGFYDD